jgi:hypothetical protein
VTSARLERLARLESRRPSERPWFDAGPAAIAMLQWCVASAEAVNAGKACWLQMTRFAAIGLRTSLARQARRGMEAMAATGTRTGSRGAKPARRVFFVLAFGQHAAALPCPLAVRQARISHLLPPSPGGRGRIAAVHRFSGEAQQCGNWIRFS